jgi:peptidyl-dipeptidase Dcp
MKTIILMFIITSLCFASCKQEEKNLNPLLGEFDTPFGIPPFGQIKVSHFIPAYIKAFEEQNEIVRKIITNKQTPTFNNTIRELEYSDELLTRISRIFGGLSSAHTNDSLQAVNIQIAPLLSKHYDNINLNDTLFRRIKSVYDNKEKFNLTDEERKVLDDTYKGFVRNGAELSPGDKDKLRKINEELSLLSVKFGQNLLAETNSFKLIIDKKEDLKGLPASFIEQAALTADQLDLKDKWVFTIQYPIMEPFLKYSESRALREKLFTAYFMKGDNDNQNDNKSIIAGITRLRIERSELLGYKSYSDFVLERNMAKTPERVMEFLGQVWNAALPAAKYEAAALQEMIDKEGGQFSLQPWDWWYYTEKIKREKYALDDEMTRPFFKTENVIEGMFYVANRLYDLTFIQRTDIPKYHPDVLTYEVTRNNKHVGVLMIDNFPRTSKRSGAWCGAYRGQRRDRNGNMINPVVTVVTNLTPPSSDKPSLLTPDEASTLFHEFGHALHQLLSNSTYPSVSGTSVPRDFVELPSQIMEHWVLEPEVLKVYAKHYVTQEPIPDEIIGKLDKAAKFNTGFTTVEFLAAALLDMEYHMLNDPVDINVRDFEKQVLDRYGLIPEIKPRYRSTYFNHIWSSGYASGYYSYYWSEMLDADAFQAFKETGDIFNREVAARFENEILSRGGSRDPLEMYIAFRGKEPGINALLENRGLK